MTIPSPEKCVCRKKLGHEYCKCYCKCHELVQAQSRAREILEQVPTMPPFFMPILVKLLSDALKAEREAGWDEGVKEARLYNETIGEARQAALEQAAKIAETTNVLLRNANTAIAARIRQLGK